ncbi:MAG: GNAT family N-acetyltransferase [Candidatus Heimdallarchaeota archaeon]|nr:MAG: GNAT family N-acetyltransferase [Candidatus Heimdallarchaeota archaeon]
MEVREYQKSDTEGILLLHEEFETEFLEEHRIITGRGRQKSDLENIYQSYHQKDRKFWVIDQEGEIIGMVGVIIVDESTAELIRMRVKNHYRNQGLGKKLLSKVEEYCINIGMKRIILHTAKRLVIARKMYEKYGFNLYNEQVIQWPVQFTMLSYYKDLNG